MRPICLSMVLRQKTKTMSIEDTKNPIKIFLLAGEPSGDALGARLMIGLRQRVPKKYSIEFHGVGGALMEKEGLKSLFPMDELTIMGVIEVFPKIPQLLRLINKTAQAAKDLNPDAFVTIDAPDFSFRVAKKLKSVSFPKVHYVAPSVWAWRPGRAAKIAKLYDHLLTLLPFEPPYFEKEGLAATFVGHSVIETGAGHGDGEKFRSLHNLGPNDPVLMILPGSRRSEVSRHLDIFKETAIHVQKSIPDLTIVVPVIGKSSQIVKEHLKTWPMRTITVEGETDKYDAMAGSDVALAASGTVGLELALARLPAIIAYKMHPITAYLARKLVKLDYVNLVNILLNKEVVPEHILENCQAEILAPSLIDLLENQSKAKIQIEGYEKAVASLGVGGDAPGIRAADVVLKISGLTEVPDRHEK